MAAQSPDDRGSPESCGQGLGSQADGVSAARVAQRLRASAWRFFARVYRRIRRLNRHRLYGRLGAPDKLSYRERNGSISTGTPVAVIGMTVRVSLDSRGSRMVHFWEAVNPQHFLAAWYVIGQADVYDEDGIPWDPDD